MTSRPNLTPSTADTGITADGPAQRRARTRAAAGRRTRAVAGLALAWPWFDGLAAWTLRRFFFPASRLWAAAQMADGSPERFFDAVPMSRRFDDRERLETALAHFDKERTRAEALEAEWQKVFFGPEESSSTHRSAVEAARLDGAHAYNIARRRFGFLIKRGVPSVKLETRSPSEAAASYGAALKDLAPFVTPPDAMPEIETSRSIKSSIGPEYWLRFKSPSARLGDTVYARVHEPLGVIDPPTLIYGHGVCVEFDHWRGLIDETYTLCAAGFRVIRPEAPWHGRRAPRGYFGGERLIATFPTGPLDAFTGALREWAVLADWSRRTSRGALTFGGTSLGAQFAQLAADRAREWPERLRPDALFLVTHCGRMADTILHGDIAKIFGGANEAVAKGWTPELIEAYLGLLDPRGEPPVAPEKIVTLLGSRDTVTPFTSGLPLIRGWGVPAENTFVWNRGHFSVPMTLIRDQAPVRRFCEVVGKLRG